MIYVNQLIWRQGRSRECSETRRNKRRNMEHLSKQWRTQDILHGNWQNGLKHDHLLDVPTEWRGVGKASNQQTSETSHILQDGIRTTAGGSGIRQEQTGNLQCVKNVTSDGRDMTQYH